MPEERPAWRLRFERGNWERVRLYDVKERQLTAICFGRHRNWGCAWSCSCACWPCGRQPAGAPSLPRSPPNQTTCASSNCASRSCPSSTTHACWSSSRGAWPTVKDFPVAITFRLPQRAQINQMATVNMQSAGTTIMPYESQPDPTDARWQLVTYNLDGAHFFYEYYYETIIGNVDKEFTYTLNSYHPVDDASVEIQEPKAAEGFSTSPQAAATRLDQNLRLYYHQIPLGALQPGRIPPSASPIPRSIPTLPSPGSRSWRCRKASGRQRSPRSRHHQAFRFPWKSLSSWEGPCSSSSAPLSATGCGWPMPQRSKPARASRTYSAAGAAQRSRPMPASATSVAPWCSNHLSTSNKRRQPPVGRVASGGN